METEETACERCGKLIEALRRGRPRRYCGDACRKAAQRARDREAALDRRRAAEIATARAEAARTWRPLEEASAEVADLAATVLACAAGDDRGSLTATLGELRAASAELARLAEAYFDAAQLVARSGGLAAPRAGQSAG